MRKYYDVKIYLVTCLLQLLWLEVVEHLVTSWLQCSIICENFETFSCCLVFYFGSIICKCLIIFSLALACNYSLTSFSNM